MTRDLGRRPDQRMPPTLGRHLAWALGDYPNTMRLRIASLRDRRLPRSFAHGDRRPVVIVPGVWESWHWLGAIAQALNAAGHPVHVVPELRLNLAPIPEGAALLARFLRERDLRGVALVAHSKGGLIGKTVMLHDADSRVDRLIAVATPFAGSRLARYALGRTYRAFHPAHPVIRTLAAEQAVHDRITSIFPAFDPHIPDGSRLPGAANVEIPVVGHFRILTDARAIEAVLAAVTRE